MRETTNFNFKIPEGADIVNPIIDPYRNWDTIDPILKAVKDSTITNASHVKSGDTHVLIRENADSNNIKFVATGDWRIGDTLTVDGITVQCRLTDGESLHSNAFVTNQEVFCILHGQVLTMYVTESLQDIKDDIIQIQSDVITINNDLSVNTPLSTVAQNVHGAINENKTNIDANTSAIAELDTELSNSLKWTSVGLLPVDGSINLPAEYNEILIDFTITTGTENVRATLYLPKNVLGGSPRLYRTGYYANANAGASFSVEGTLTQIRGLNVWQNNRDLTHVSGAIICEVYYR